MKFKYLITLYFCLHFVGCEKEAKILQAKPEKVFLVQFKVPPSESELKTLSENLNLQIDEKVNSTDIRFRGSANVDEFKLRNDPKIKRVDSVGVLEF